MAQVAESLPPKGETPSALSGSQLWSWLCPGGCAHFGTEPVDESPQSLSFSASHTNNTLKTNKQGKMGLNSQPPWLGMTGCCIRVI